MVAVDALAYSRKHAQYNVRDVNRELQKVDSNFFYSSNLSTLCCPLSAIVLVRLNWKCWESNFTCRRLTELVPTVGAFSVLIRFLAKNSFLAASGLSFPAKFVFLKFFKRMLENW